MGKKENLEAGSPRHSLRRRQNPQLRGHRGYTDPPLLWLFSPPTADPWERVLSLGFFLCGEDPLEAEFEAGRG